MALRTYSEYLDSLRRMRPNIHKFDELINDVTTHPATRNTIEGHGQSYKLLDDPAEREILTTTSSLTGEPISRYLSIIRAPEDMYANSRLKRHMFQKTGTCTGGRCVGWTALNSMFLTTYEMDQKLGTDYHVRLLNWLRDAQSRDITVSGALTDPKGDRTKSPMAQDDPDMCLHIVEKRPDGIVVRGAKVMICGVAASNEIFILPGSGYKEAEKDYALSFVIPRDIENLTIVETRRPSDTRETEEGFDIPVKDGGITQAYLLFENVFIPKERVFMAGEYEFALNAVKYFISAYRAAIGGCVAGQGDVKIGAAVLTARANGLSSKVFNDKLVKMHINNETTYGVGIAAAALGKRHPSGAWVCDMLLSNVNKIHVATLPYETSLLAQDIAGGIAETGCIPAYKDIVSPKYGHLLKKYLKARHSAESRVRAARLVEWATIGAGVPGCMHGGGSPDGAKLMIRASENLEEKVQFARRLAGITEEIPEPEPKK
ncbi:4-hydroxybutyryl-CoA dehydratase/vinylacetyl-CoA-Delta-isomerase [Candidatus Zixiibacteriota bacterium]|nr:4-hydroxybutyryl-CoA dehydratase/vinylacetyl-CoA-Delta-isomerase [candidate division Zixibacteria bacterium]